MGKGYPKKFRLLCPKCGEKAEIKETKYGFRASHCGLWSWDGKPLVDADTHAARRLAHFHFDALWKGRLMTRTEAYRALGEMMGLKPHQTHIALFTKEQAQTVPDYANRIKSQLHGITE